MAAATAVLAFPIPETSAIADSIENDSITASQPSGTRQLQPPLNIDDISRGGAVEEVNTSTSDWKGPTQSTFEFSSGESEVESSSLDSFQLTESPDATTISTASHRSSLSSVSGVIRKNRSKGLQWPMSPKNQRGPVTSPRLRPLAALHKSEYHELKDQLGKFNSRQGPARANYLRLSLLSFLRRHKMYLMPGASEQDFPLRVLGAWYNQLLSDLNTSQRNVNGSDRNAFYEGISGLMSRPEWLDHHQEPLYQSLLQRTIVHTLSKCSIMPNLPVAQAAHLGKVLAYGFFYVPGVASYLLKFLNVRRETVARFMSLGAQTASHRIQLVGVPAHLQHLINATAVRPDSPAPLWLNSVPEGSWVRHWHAESIVFSSFLKNLSSLETQFFPIMNPLGVGSAEGEDANAAEELVLSAPGMIIILCALVENFDAVVSQSNRALGTRSGNPYARRTPLVAGTQPVATNPGGRVRINQIKCFAAFREILHSDDSTLFYFTSFSRAFDRIVRATAIRCEVYDMDSCVTVCDLAEEWMSSVFLVPSPKSEQHILANHYRIMDWKFWLTVSQRMLKSDNSHTEIRALSFLFNVWPHIPGYYREHNIDSSYLQEATEWLLSPDMFMQLFCHWSPLVRSYYHRILCYRIASVGTNAESWFLDVESAEYYTESRALLTRRLQSLVTWCTDLASTTSASPSTAPSLPVPRMCIAIRPNAAQQTASHRIESGISRLYPFDIFDNAAYWLPEPSHPEANELERQSSVSSKASSQTSATAISVMSGRSMSTMSSALSGSSVASNDSDRSDISAATQSSRASSLLSLNSLVIALPFTAAKKPTSEGEGQNDETTDRSNASAEKTEPASPSDNIALSFKRRWSLFRGLLAGKTSSRDATTEPITVSATQFEPEPDSTVPVTASDSAPAHSATHPLGGGPKASSPVEKSSQPILRTRSRANTKTIKLSKQEKHRKSLERKRTLRMNRKREQHEAAQAVVPLPPQLGELRPEISRAPFRFVLIPGNGPPLSADKDRLAFPRLPFSKTISGDHFGTALRTKSADLAVWNYGFRSLAEWDVAVNIFESFAAQQHESACGNIQLLQMPFLVAEIPWRAVG